MTRILFLFYFQNILNILSTYLRLSDGTEYLLCASAAETRFSVTAESKAMLYIPLQRNTM